MPGGEKLQYPFPYKNESGLAGNEGDLELDNLVVNNDVFIGGDLIVGGTIYGDFNGEFTGPYFTATADNDQWRTTSTTGVTEFKAMNQLNPTYRFVNQNNVVSNSTIVAGAVSLYDVDNISVGMSLVEGRGTIRSSDSAFGIDIVTGPNKQIKLDTGGGGDVFVEGWTTFANRNAGDSQAYISTHKPTVFVDNSILIPAIPPVIPKPDTYTVEDRTLLSANEKGLDLGAGDIDGTIRFTTKNEDHTDFENVSFY